jgi:hypothetical protein
MGSGVLAWTWWPDIRALLGLIVVGIPERTGISITNPYTSHAFIVHDNPLPLGQDIFIIPPRGVGTDMAVLCV